MSAAGRITIASAQSFDTSHADRGKQPLSNAAMNRVEAGPGAGGGQDVAARLAEDRDRVAEELNERVVGRLFRVGLGLSGLASVLADASQRTAVLGYVEELDTAIGQIRSVIFELDDPNRDFRRPGLPNGEAPGCRDRGDCTGEAGRRQTTTRIQTRT